MYVLCIYVSSTNEAGKLTHIQSWYLHIHYSNQIRVVVFKVPHLTQASLLQKHQTLQNVFLISEMLRRHRASVVSSLQKSEFLKLIIPFFHYLWCQNWDQWHKMSGKNTHIYFFYFWFKNKRVWAEKIRKKRKPFKNLKVADNYPKGAITNYIYKIWLFLTTYPPLFTFSMV